MSAQVQKMIEKLEHLSEDRLAEVSDFIDFLQFKDQEIRLRSDFTKASDETFSKIWDNEDDAQYDRL